MTTRISGRPTRRSGRGMEAHPKVQLGSGVPTGGPGEVGKPTWRHGRIRKDHLNILEAHTEVQVGLGGPPSSLEGVGGPRGELGGSETHLEFRKAHPESQEGMGGVERPAQRSKRVR